MHTKVHERFHDILVATGARPERALELGGYMGANSLLRFPELAGASRYCLNLVARPSHRGITSVTGNGNDMPFEDEHFDLVMCNATLEHDKRFWLSVAEMRRVLRPGGLLIIGVPGYVKDAERDRGRATMTHRVHYRFDYYRFSEQAVREVLFEGMDAVDVAPFLRPPRIIGYGWKPGADKLGHVPAQPVRGREPAGGKGVRRLGSGGLRARVRRFLGRARR